MTEDQLEQEALGWLADVGYQHRYGPDLTPDGPAPERRDYRQVLLVERLHQAVATLNPTVPQAARDDARMIVDLLQAKIRASGTFLSRCHCLSSSVICEPR